MTKKSMSFNDTVIVTVRKNYYGNHFWGMDKSEAMKKMKQVDNYNIEKKCFVAPPRPHPPPPPKKKKN